MRRTAYDARSSSSVSSGDGANRSQFHPRAARRRRRRRRVRRRRRRRRRVAQPRPAAHRPGLPHRAAEAVELSLRVGAGDLRDRIADLRAQSIELPAQLGTDVPPSPESPWSACATAAASTAEAAAALQRGLQLRHLEQRHPALRGKIVEGDVHVGTVC